MTLSIDVKTPRARYPLNVFSLSRSSFCMHDTRSDLHCAGVGLGIAPRLFAKVTEGVSRQSFNSGHGIPGADTGFMKGGGTIY